MTVFRAFTGVTNELSIIGEICGLAEVLDSSGVCVNDSFIVAGYTNPAAANRQNEIWFLERPWAAHQRYPQSSASPLWTENSCISTYVSGYLWLLYFSVLSFSDWLILSRWILIKEKKLTHTNANITFERTLCDHHMCCSETIIHPPLHKPWPQTARLTLCLFYLCYRHSHEI